MKPFAVNRPPNFTSTPQGQHNTKPDQCQPKYDACNHDGPRLFPPAAPQSSRPSGSVMGLAPDPPVNFFAIHRHLARHIDADPDLRPIPQASRAAMTVLAEPDEDLLADPQALAGQRAATQQCLRRCR